MHKVLSPILALLVLLSTVSWTVDKHLCMGRVMDTSLFLPAQDCGMEAAMAVLDKGFENHCCADESFTIQGQDDLKLSWDQLDIDAKYFPIPFCQSSFQSGILPAKNSFPEKLHPPPLMAADLNVLFEVFLI